MKFKRLDKVSFLGGVFPIGFEEGSDNWLKEDLKPIPTTFVWDAIRSQDTDLFVVQHNDGATLDVFMHYSSFFGKIERKGLREDKKYVLVTEEALSMIEESKAPSPVKEEVIVPTSNEEPVIKERVIVDIITPSEVEEVVAHEEDVVVYEEGVVEGSTYGVHNPHFSAQTCPVNRMMNTVSKPQISKSLKMSEPFTIDGVNGIEKGRAGDFLMLSNLGYLYIYPKEGFDSNFEYAEELISLPILGKTFNIMPEVAEYIDKLQVTSSDS